MSFEDDLAAMLGPTGPVTQTMLDTPIGPTKQEVAAAVAPAPGTAIVPTQPGTTQPTAPPDKPTNASADVSAIINPFTAAPDIASKEDAAIATQEQVTKNLQTAQAVQNQIGPAKEKLAQTRADAINVFAGNITDATVDFQKVTEPLKQRNQFIADRQRQITDGNPILMGLHGLFDKTWNPDWLAEESNAVHGQLAAHSLSYENLIKTNAELAQASDQQYQAAVGALDVKGQNADADSRISAGIAASTLQVATDEVGKLGASMETLKAQEAIRRDEIDKMTPQELNKYGAQAHAAGGTVTVNGHILHESELKKASMEWDTQQTALANAKNSLAMGNIDLHNKNEGQVLAHMNPSQILKAMSDGVYSNGMKVNQAMAGQYLESAKQAGILAADTIAQSTGIPAAMSQYVNLGRVTGLAAVRSQELFGVADPEQVRLSQSIATKLHGYTAAIQQGTAISGDTGRQVVANQQKELDGLFQQQDAHRLAMAKRFGNGDASMTQWAYDRLGGAQSSVEVTNRAIISMVRLGQIPPGMQVTPEFNQTWNALTKVVNDHDLGKGLNNQIQIDARMKSAKDRTYDTDLLQATNGLIQNLYKSHAITSMQAQAPAMAAQIKMPDGQPHPASRINPQDITSANQIVDHLGHDFLKNTLGLDDAQTSSIQQSGKDSAGWRAYESRTVGRNNQPRLSFEQVMGQYKANENTAFLLALRNSPSARPGFDPAAAFVDLMANKDWQQLSYAKQAGQAMRNPGDSMLHSIGGTQLQKGIIDYATGMQNSFATLDMGRNKAALRQMSSFRNLAPQQSAEFALHTNQHINPKEVSALMDYVMPKAQQLVAQKGGQLSDAIDAVITNTKAEDPAIEQIRKRAASDWAARRMQMDKGIAGVNGQAYQPSSAATDIGRIPVPAPIANAYEGAQDLLRIP